jgi:hypothetical protein
MTDRVVWFAILLELFGADHDWPKGSPPPDSTDFDRVSEPGVSSAIPARSSAMKLRRSSDRESAPSPTGFVGDHADKLSRVSPLTHDEDEQPSREDRDYGSTIFTRPSVPLPRFLSPKKRPPG